MSGKSFSQGVSYLFHRLPASEVWLHAIVMSVVLLQIFSSFFMHVHGDTGLAALTAVDWYHITAGLGLVLLTPVFMALLLKRRHWQDLYPWMRGDFTQIKMDISTLVSKHLPDAKPAGLAATVEGLGLLALLLALISGASWLAGLYSGWSFTPALLELHKTLVGLIEAYVYGHGGFALLHLVVWLRNR